MTQPSFENRRQLRISAAEGSYALDVMGNELGRVVNLSGGGLLVHCTSAAIAEHLIDEGELRILIVDPRSQASSPADVVVRYREGLNVGFEYADTTSNE
jgi:hypothetical protein